MIVVTGAAGFIGSCLVKKLNQAGYTDLILVDNFDSKAKNLNLSDKVFLHQIERDHFFERVKKFENDIDFFFHLGARSNTLETSSEVFDRLNYQYSKNVWNLCASQQIPLIYASSAATYGDGSFGFTEDEKTTQQLLPLNAYAASKHKFDLWALRQTEQPPFWTGLKFFNVFGPNEYHKGKMASMVYQAYLQVKETGKLKLYKSHNCNFEDGEQQRDFIYIHDILNICLDLMEAKQDAGLLNIGTGQLISYRKILTKMTPSDSVSQRTLL